MRTLKKFLLSRGAARFYSNDYYESDRRGWTWMRPSTSCHPANMRTYNDEVFGYKGSLRSVCECSRRCRNRENSSSSAAICKRVEKQSADRSQGIRNPKLGSQAPIRVVNEVLSAGDGDHGVQTAAYNLPNDDRVVAQKGSKRVMLKNVQEAKFRSTLEPISKRVLARPANQSKDRELIQTRSSRTSWRTN